MHIRVIYFQAIRGTLGVEEESYDLTDSATVKGAVAAITGRHPQIRKWGRSLMFAVNQEWASPDTSLKENDTLALMPPVSGG